MAKKGRQLRSLSTKLYGLRINLSVSKDNRQSQR